MKTCTECSGRRYIPCPVCRGSGTMRNDARTSKCSYCSGFGKMSCNICGGKGQIDDNESYARW